MIKTKELLDWVTKKIQEYMVLKESHKQKHGAQLSMGEVLKYVQL